jgi:hypothetical protein
MSSPSPEKHQRAQLWIGMIGISAIVAALITYKAYIEPRAPVEGSSREQREPCIAQVDELWSSGWGPSPARATALGRSPALRPAHSPGPDNLRPAGNELGQDRLSGAGSCSVARHFGRPQRHGRQYGRNSQRSPSRCDRITARQRSASARALDCSTPSDQPRAMRKALAGGRNGLA